MEQRGNTPRVPSTVVCVTDQFSCERLIHVGRKIADMAKTPLYVISSGKPSRSINHDALEHLFTVSKEYGATMDVFYSETPFDTLIEYLRDSAALHVVTGMPQEENSILNRLWRDFPDKHFYTVDTDSSYSPIPAEEKAGLSAG